MTLERFVYRSVSTHCFVEKDRINCIFRSARKKNSAAGLTGALSYSGHKFVQVLEGPTQALDGLIAILESDNRHNHLNILGRWQIQDRMFCQWSMAHACLSSSSERLKRRFESDGSGAELVNLLYSAASKSVFPL